MLDLVERSSMSGWGRRKWSLLGFVPYGRSQRVVASEDGVLMLFAEVVRSCIRCISSPLKGETGVSGNGSMEMDVDVVDGQEVAQEHSSLCLLRLARLKVSSYVRVQQDRRYIIG